MSLFFFIHPTNSLALCLHTFIMHILKVVRFRILFISFRYIFLVFSLSLSEEKRYGGWLGGGVVPYIWAPVVFRSRSRIQAPIHNIDGNTESPYAPQRRAVRCAACPPPACHGPHGWPASRCPALWLGCVCVCVYVRERKRECVCVPVCPSSRTQVEKTVVDLETDSD